MKFLRYFLPLAILAICGYVTWILMSARPEPRRYNREAFEPEIEVSKLILQDYQVILKSQGIIEARTQSALIPEVRGRILKVSPNFRAGGFFEEGELLVEIDASDYETELIVADATLAQMQLRFAEEKVRAERAELDWTRLGNEGDAPELVLRRPQMRQAEANLASAAARLKAAKLNLQRTQITAPYAGRILKKNADVGQYVSPGNQLATLYAIDFAEVRLPLSEAQLGFIDLPESYRGDDAEPRISKEVELSVRNGETRTNWTGELVRAEGAFDQRSRQLYVVAQITDPYGNSEDGRPTLKVGSFAEASIPGKLLEDVFVIPRRLFRESDYVIVVDPEDRLVRRSVQPLWSDEKNIVVRDELSQGERLCLTPIKYPTTGMKVRLKPDPLEAQARAERQFERFQQVIAALPEDVDLPIHLKIQVKSLQARNDLNQAGSLVNELIRWARQNDVELPSSLTDRPQKEKKPQSSKEPNA